jgi:hypothetical protein
LRIVRETGAIEVYRCHSPALQCGVAEVDFAPATEQQSDSVSCYIVGAIVGHITDDDALLCGSLNINIVNPHAVADNHAAALQLLNDLTVYRGIDSSRWRQRQSNAEAHLQPRKSWGTRVQRRAGRKILAPKKCPRTQHQ